MSRIYQKSLDKCSTFSSKPVIQYFIIKSVSCFFFFFDETLILALALNNRDGRNKTQRCTDCNVRKFVQNWTVEESENENSV